MKKLSNTETELKKALLIKKRVLVLLANKSNFKYQHMDRGNAISKLVVGRDQRQLQMFLNQKNDLFGTYKLWKHNNALLLYLKQRESK